MNKNLIIGLLWGAMAVGVLVRDSNIEKKYQCEFTWFHRIVTVVLAPGIYVAAVVADNERTSPPPGCKEASRE